MAAALPLLRSPITIVWFFLIAATAISWYAGGDEGINDAELAGSLVLAIAFIKVRFVGMYFMELRHAPIPLRIIFETWCVVVCATVITMFLVI